MNIILSVFNCSGLLGLHGGSRHLPGTGEGEQSRKGQLRMSAPKFTRWLQPPALYKEGSIKLAEQVDVG